MKPKEALVKDGFLPAGAENKRGRLSADAIARCEALVSQGWKIDGYESKADNTVAKVKVPTGVKEVADIGDPIHDEREWSAYVTVGDKTQTVDMRTCCNLCGRSSLTYCPHPEPQVFVDFDQSAVVSFKQRNKPLVRRWW